jgi:hypothetical protein
MIYTTNAEIPRTVFPLETTWQLLAFLSVSNFLVKNTLVHHLIKVSGVL